MEDEQATVGQGSCIGGVSENPLCGDLPAETPIEKMDGEDGSCGGEVMVEIVGSDVFVDGHKEGDFGAAEVRDLESGQESGTQNLTKNVSILCERHGNEAGQNEPDCFEDGAICALRRGRVGALGDGVDNQGVDGLAVSVMATMEVVNVEKETVTEAFKDESVDDELVNSPVEVAVDEVGFGRTENLSIGLQEARVDEIDAGVVGCVDTGKRGKISADSRANNDTGSYDGGCGVQEKHIHEKEAMAAESKGLILNSNAQVCEVQNENQGCLNQLHCTKVELSVDEKSVSIGTVKADGVKSDDSHYLRDGVPDINPPNLSLVVDNSCLTINGGVENSMIHQDHVFSNGSASFVPGDDPAKANKNEGLNIANWADIEKNQQNSYPGDRGFGQADSGICENQHVIAMQVGGVIDTQGVLMSCMNAVNGDEMKKQGLEFQVKAEITTNGAYQNANEHAAYNVHFVDSQANTDNVSKEYCTHTVQKPEIANCKVEKLEGVDLMPQEVASTRAVTGIAHPNIFPVKTEKAVFLQGSNGKTEIDGYPKIYEISAKRSIVISAKLYSVDEMLLQLQLLAQNKGHDFQYNIRSFFEGFRSLIASNGQGKITKDNPKIGRLGEEVKFDGAGSPCLMDKIVHSYSAEQLLRDCGKEAGNPQMVRFVAEEYMIPTPKSRKRFSNGSHPMAAMEIVDNVKRRKQESSPAELILNFADMKRLPLEITLNKMFRRFGPLMESETEVDHDLGRAKVIFKRGSDAEVALNSSKKFNIFGSVLVNYQINYSPVVSVKISPPTLHQSHNDMTLML